MDEEGQREALGALIARDGATLAELSRVVGRNAAWMQQYMKRGTPRLLPERERSLLARFFGVSEELLGGPAAAGVVRVARFDVAASAGPGRVAAGEFAQGAVGYVAEDLVRLGVRPADASVIEVAGESMVPTLVDGDEILVDRSQRGPRGGGGIWVIRVDGELRVKRLVRLHGAWRIVSDNPAWPDEERPLDEVEVLGRVVHLRRRL